MAVLSRDWKPSIVAMVMIITSFHAQVHAKSLQNRAIISLVSQLIDRFRLLDVAPNSNPLRLKRFAPSISISFKCQCRIIMQMKRTKNLNPQRLELGDSFD